MSDRDLASVARPSLVVDVHLTPEDARRSLRSDVRRGLCATPKWLPPKWFYDDRGSQLFDAITRLPEYYPTRTERAILTSHAKEIAVRTRAETLVELGSGTSEKTRILLDAFSDVGSLERFAPFDVSEQTLREAASAVVRDYPGVTVHAVVGDFEHHLDRLPAGGRRCIVFLGGTIGNLFPDERRAFFRAVAAGLEPGDSFLLGTDLVKDRVRLERAYDDAAGITAEFNKNVLHVINHELRADFDVEAFDHVARYDPRSEWIAMYLVARRRQQVRIDDLGLDIEFEPGEELRTEISAKFRIDGIADELAAAELHVDATWTDPATDFALTLAVPAT